MKAKNLVLYLFVLIFSVLELSLFAQSDIKNEAMLTSKKWTCLEVSRKKLQKMDFRFEIGNELSMRIDKKYSFKNNDFNFQSGKWELDGKTLYFFYHSAEDMGRTLSARYKVLKLNEDELSLKRLDKPKGKLLFK